ncbi:MAG TPA: hypothetical protein VM782_08945 [Stellaceae bacterium]|nr:hypothetical protein [Stellaceae bacterium]
MTPLSPGFAAFRAPVDRTVFEPGFRLWLRVSRPLDRFWRTVLRLPERRPDAANDDLPPEYFRFPPF